MLFVVFRQKLFLNAENAYVLSEMDKFFSKVMLFCSVPKIFCTFVRFVS